MKLDEDFWRDGFDVDRFAVNISAGFGPLGMLHGQLRNLDFTGFCQDLAGLAHRVQAIWMQQKQDGGDLERQGFLYAATSSFWYAVMTSRE